MTTKSGTSVLQPLTACTGGLSRRTIARWRALLWATALKTAEPPLRTTQLLTGYVCDADDDGRAPARSHVKQGHRGRGSQQPQPQAGLAVAGSAVAICAPRIRPIVRCPAVARLITRTPVHYCWRSSCDGRGNRSASNPTVSVELGATQVALSMCLQTHSDFL